MIAPVIFVKIDVMRGKVSEVHLYETIQLSAESENPNIFNEAISGILPP